MSADKLITKTIQAGNLPLVVQLVKDSSQKSGPAPVDSSFRHLKDLYSFCYKSIKENKKPSSTEVDSVFELTTIFCENIATTWRCKRFPFLQCLYYINNYLVKHNALHARKVSEFFFQLKASSFDTSWETNEILVIVNVVQDFITHVNDRRLHVLSSTGENSLESWLDFAFRLYELNDLNKLYKLFIVLDTLWFTAYSQCKHKLKECISQCLNKLAMWLKHLSVSDVEVKLADKDIFGFFNLVERATAMLSEDELLPLFNTIRNCLDCLKTLFPQCVEDVEIVNSCLSFFGSINKPTEALGSFDVMFSTIINRNTKISTALLVAVNFIIKFRSSMLKVEFSPVIEARIHNVVKLVLELMLCSRKESDGPLKVSRMILDLTYCGLSFASLAVDKDSLRNVFPSVQSLTRQFMKVMSNAENPAIVSAVVSAILNAVLSFKKAESYVEAMWLCKYVLLIFFKIQPNVLWEDYYYKTYVETWLRNIVLAYAKCNCGLDAQVLLIAFAAYQPKYTMAAMKAWATLKKLNPQNLEKDATTLEVMMANAEAIETQFPHIKLSDINSNLLLLGEIYAYTKLRELRGDPVLVVYKSAAKTVKDHVALGNILCCAVESFSIDTSDTVHFSKLVASLNNMIKHLQQLQEKSQEGELDKSAILCTLGNLFYHKARLEIQQIRQKSEAEVAANEKWNAKNKIPVIRAGEKDDLDMTEVDMVGSAFKLNQNSDVSLFLNNALNYWILAEQSLVPNPLLEPTLSFVKGAGYLSRLHGFKTLETTSWNLLYRMALKMECVKYQVLAASELLSSCRTVNPAIIEEIENMMQNKKRVDRKSYVHHLYMVSYAKNLLFCGKVEESRKALEKIDVSAVAPHFLVNAQFTVLKTLLELEQPKDETPLLPIVRLFENILYIIHHNDWDTFNEVCVVQSIKIETSKLLGTVYSDLKCVRQARLYTKTELSIVQRLVLPASVCEFMTLKCWIDLLTWNVIDSDLNAQEVENMLELGVLKTEGASPSKLIPDGVQRSAIKCVPHFLNKKECDCNQCVSSNYPSLALNAIVNRILILLGNGVRAEAQNVINVGLSVVEIVEQQNRSSNALWSPFSSSSARFYYVVARSYVLWGKLKEGVHYANRACEILLSEPIKNHGLIASTEQIIMETKSIPNYVKPPRILPVSQRFAVKLGDERAVTPEPQKYSHSKPWESSVHNQKTSVAGFYTHRKSVLSKTLKFPGPGADENEDPNDFGCVALEGTTPETAVKKGDRTKKVLVPTIVVSNPPAEPKFFKKRLEVGESKFDDKLHLKMAALVLGDGDVRTPVDKRTGRKALVGSSRKAQTEKKPQLPRKNLFNAGSISSLASTPAVKVFYDPDGLEHSTNSTAKKNKIKDGGTTKRTTRLAALSKVVNLEKFGTPTASKTKLTAKGKLTFDDGSDNELELVHSAPRKQHSKRNAKKCGADETDAVSTGSCESSKPKLNAEDSEFQDSMIVVNSRKVVNRCRKGETALTKRVIQDDTTVMEVSLDDSGDEIVSKPPASEASQVEKPVRSGSRRLMCGGSTLAAPISTPNPVETKRADLKVKSDLEDSEEEEEEDEPVAAPFRKVLNKGKSSSSRRLIHDETTINSSGMTAQTSFDDSQIAASSRKVVNRSKTGPSKRLIHDDTTLPDQSTSSPDLIDSSVVETPAPRIARRRLVQQSQLKPTPSTAKEPSVVLAKKSTSRSIKRPT
ncbi:hypothetical protein GE061_006821 [Apolygus lucorum]|uniref:Uncharacterized protein n=1 Tax=Apolygus lucorum TaxID=248454 RepID=A0A8S9WRP3_APOLU|nr:hypothetical protein GE061_006821 [Apolygus lucorum]